MRPQLELILGGGHVRRFHTIPMVNENTVGHHSFGVALMVWLLTGGKTGSELLINALGHDLAEVEVGDIPAPTKRILNNGELRSLETTVLESAGIVLPPITEEEKRVLKLADRLDGALNCVYEKRLGNTYIEPIFWKFITYARELKIRAGNETSIYSAILNMFEEADHGGERE